MSLVSCHVQKHSTTADGVTEYFINVVFIGKQWGIRKRYHHHHNHHHNHHNYNHHNHHNHNHHRYRDFLKFDEFLRKDNVIINSELPPKKWWNRLDPTLIAIRMKALQGYLDELLKCVSLSESSLLREFLEVDVINLQVAKKKSMKGIDYNDRMKAIINDASKNMVSMTVVQRQAPINRSNSEKKDRKGKSATIPIPSPFMTNFDSNGSPLPSPSSSSIASSSFRGSPIVSSPIVSSSFTSSSFTRKALKRTESNTSTTDHERPLYERKFTFDRINSIGASPSVSANTAFGSALYEAATDGMKKEIFAQHVSKLWTTYQKQTDEILTDFEYKSLPVSLANDNDQVCLKFINEPLTIVEDLDQLLDTCADILLESSPKQSFAFISNDFVIEKFKTLPQNLDKNRSNSSHCDSNIKTNNPESSEDTPRIQPSPLSIPFEEASVSDMKPSPSKISKACRI